MSAGKKSKHIKNRFSLITDKVAQGYLEIHHKGTDEMWADVNTKPVQGRKFRVMRAEVMGISVEYDDDKERRGTHPLLLPKIEPDRISGTDFEILKKVAVATPSKSHKTKKRAPVVNKLVTRMKPIGSTDKSISRRAKPVQNRRSVLDGKYTSGKGLKWERRKSSPEGLYERLLAELCKATRRNLTRRSIEVIRKRETAVIIRPG